MTHSFETRLLTLGLSACRALARLRCRAIRYDTIASAGGTAPHSASTAHRRLVSCPPASRSPVRTADTPLPGVVSVPFSQTAPCAPSPALARLPSPIRLELPDDTTNGMTNGSVALPGGIQAHVRRAHAVADERREERPRVGAEDGANVADEEPDGEGGQVDLMRGER